MPNWCTNQVTFNHTDAAEITKVVDACRTGNLFGAFLPTPTELTAATSPNPDKKLEIDYTEKYGAPDWYTWNIKNWGTKWDIGEEIKPQSIEVNSVTFGFDSAWSPPIEFYKHMAEQGFKIHALYFEPGMSFGGEFDHDSGEHTYEICSEDDVTDEMEDTFSILQYFDQDEEEAQKSTKFERLQYNLFCTYRNFLRKVKHFLPKK